MNMTTQKLTDKTCILTVRTLRNVCSPNAHYLDDPAQNFDDLQDGIKRADLGAIISIEPRMIEPNQHVENWQLAQSATEGINRHYTRLFYTDKIGDDARRDLFLHENDPSILLERSAALAETLDFADNFLRSSNDADGKLVVHCIRAMHRSPALMTAILAHQLSGSSAEEVIGALRKVCPHPPQLRMGEIAFVDAFMGRGGALARAWHNTKLHEKFDVVLALELHKKFGAILDPHTPFARLSSPSFKKKL